MSTMRTVELDENVQDNDYPPPYSSRSEHRERELNKEYMISAPGALKLIEAALVLIGFVAVLAQMFPGSGFVLWVTMSAFVTSATIYILQLLGVYGQLAFLPLLELIYLIVYSLKLLVSTILSFVYFSRGPSVAATSAICFSALLLFLLDTSMAYKRYLAERSNDERRQDTSSHDGQGQRMF